MSLLVFELLSQFIHIKKFPKPPHETLNSGSKWTALSEYENNCQKFSVAAAKKVLKNGEIFKNAFLAHKMKKYLDFLFYILNRLNNNQ